MKIWFLITIIVFCTGFILKTIKISALIQSFIALAYAFFELVIMVVIASCTFWGEHQRTRSRVIERNVIFEKSRDFHAMSSKIAMLSFESKDDSIAAVKEVMIKRLNRQKYIEKILPDISFIYMFFCIFILYIVCGNGVFDLIKSWNSGNSFSGIFGTSFFVTVAFVAKIFFNSTTQAEILNLQLCISVLESAESMRKEQDSKV